MHRHTNSRRLFRLFATASVGVLLVGACGDDGAEPASPQPDDTVPTPDSNPTTNPPTAPTSDPGIEHPTGADEVVVEIASEGGFMPVEAVFTQLPTLLVAGDGSEYRQGPQIAIYPGPLLPNVQVSRRGEDRIQELLDLAAEHGLLTERVYEAPSNVADAPDTVVTIHANGATYVHRAYALGIGGGLEGSGGETGDRAELQAFVESATSDAPTEEQRYQPDTFLIRSTPVDDLSGYDIEPTVVDWPADASVALADADACAEVPAIEFAELFADANQLTFFDDGGVVYELGVKPQLPGAGC